MNLENFERLKAAILANPETVDMGTWGCRDVESPCGTVACMAGFCDWLMAVDGKTTTAFDKDGQIRGGYVFSADVKQNAAEFLQITSDQARRLFLPEQWPPSQWRNYRYCLTGKGRAAVVVNRIDYFLETGL